MLQTQFFATTFQNAEEDLQNYLRIDKVISSAKLPKIYERPVYSIDLDKTRRAF
jgi:hypothetical protein